MRLERPGSVSDELGRRESPGREIADTLEDFGFGWHVLHLYWAGRTASDR